MLIAIIFIMAIAAGRWGDWANWKLYHPTMLYICTCNLLYNLVSYDSHLWKYEPEFLVSHLMMDILYSIITLPAVALLFLSHYPHSVFKRRVFYILKWIVSMLAVEWVVYEFGKITYHRGWNILWSAFFYVVMFPVLRLHSTRPVWAYAVSVIVVIFYIFVFDISLKK